MRNGRKNVKNRSLWFISSLLQFLIAKSFDIRHYAYTSQYGQPIKISNATIILFFSSIRKLVIMKKILLLTILTFVCFSCEKAELDLNNPDVENFVQQLKNGSYKKFEKGENGKNLWLLMPNFTKDHIQSLIYFAKDTSHIKDFPVNPASSKAPFIYDRQYIILGEFLLWAVEGIRNGSGYGSLTPVLHDTTFTDNYKGLKGFEILAVRNLYQNWWNNYKENDWKEKNPLKDSPYKWF